MTKEEKNLLQYCRQQLLKHYEDAHKALESSDILSIDEDTGYRNGCKDMYETFCKIIYGRAW